MNKIIGHKAQITNITKFRSDNLHQSIIFSGSKGIGKYSLAKFFINWMLAKKLDVNNENLDFFLDEKKREKLKRFQTSNIFELNNDFLFKSKIDDVRKVIKEISLTNSTLINQKYILIDNFNTLNLNSKNALLKNIEEPPKNTYIILIDHNVLESPKTIKSRCINIRFNNLNKIQFSDFLIHNNIKFSEKELLQGFSYSDGRPGIFLKMMENDWKEILKKINYILKQKIIPQKELKFILDNYEQNPIVIDNLIKKHLFFILKKILLKNIDDLDIYKQIIKYFDFLKHPLKAELNLNNKQYLSNLFLNFKLIKI